MILRLPLLFFAYVFAELWVLAWVVRQTSVGSTILLLLATGILGVAIARRQGWRNWVKIQEQISRGEMPDREFREGLLILLAAVLLIVPGFLSDVAGLLLLVPPIRAIVARQMVGYLGRQTFVQFRTFSSYGGTVYERTGPSSEIIDAEFSRIPAEPPRLRDGTDS